MKVFKLTFASFLIQNQAICIQKIATSISLFVDSWWLLYTQPVMSEGNTSHMEIKATLQWMLSKRVKIVKLAAVEDTALKVHFTEQNFAENYLRSYFPR